MYMHIVRSRQCGKARASNSMMRWPQTRTPRGIPGSLPPRKSTSTQENCRSSLKREKDNGGIYQFWRSSRRNHAAITEWKVPPSMGLSTCHSISSHGKWSTQPSLAISPFVFSLLTESFVNFSCVDGRFSWWQGCRGFRGSSGCGQRIMIACASFAALRDLRCAWLHDPRDSVKMWIVGMAVTSKPPAGSSASPE